MTIKLNGRDVEFDAFDLECMAAYHDGCEMVTEAYRRPIGDGVTVIDSLRMMCDATLEFFDGCLGEERTREIFGERLNVKTLIEGFTEFTTAVNAELQQFGAKVANGGASRPQRRAHN